MCGRLVPPLYKAGCAAVFDMQSCHTRPRPLILEPQQKADGAAYRRQTVGLLLDWAKISHVYITLALP